MISMGEKDVSAVAAGIAAAVSVAIIGLPGDIITKIIAAVAAGSAAGLTVWILHHLKHHSAQQV